MLSHKPLSIHRERATAPRKGFAGASRLDSQCLSPRDQVIALFPEGLDVLARGLGLLHALCCRSLSSRQVVRGVGRYEPREIQPELLDEIEAEQPPHRLAQS